MVELNKNISLICNHAIVNNKALETYVSVEFKYDNYIWQGFVPIEYRRGGINIDFDDKPALYDYLNLIYSQMEPANFTRWKDEQIEFWETKKNARTTKAFFDKLAEGGWKCGECDMPRNNNPQRRIQDLKEFGYLIATDLNRFCPHCNKNTSQRIMLPVPRFSNKGNGYETWTPALRKRIISLLNNIDVYEDATSSYCLPDHKFSEIRWDSNTKSENPDTMTDEEIKKKFQLMTNQRNQQKREVCRKCFQTGERGTIFGIPFFYKGGRYWDKNIPQKGKAAEMGCIGCPWYDIEEWRKQLIARLNKK